MVLAGSINKQIVGFINGEGGRAIGLCGKDGNMVVAEQGDAHGGRPRLQHRAHRRPRLRRRARDRSTAPCSTRCSDASSSRCSRPSRSGADGQTYNVNADTFAGAIAGALRAKRLLLLTDVPGVLDKNKKLHQGADGRRRCRDLIADGTITGGMIPKVETCIYALEQGVEGVVILDGKMPHAVLLELLTDHGAGTLITR